MIRKIIWTAAIVSGALFLLYSMFSCSSPYAYLEDGGLSSEVTIDQAGLAEAAEMLALLFGIIAFVSVSRSTTKARRAWWGVGAGLIAMAGAMQIYLLEQRSACLSGTRYLHLERNADE